MIGTWIQDVHGPLLILGSSADLGDLESREHHIVFLLSWALCNLNPLIDVLIWKLLVVVSVDLFVLFNFCVGILVVFW